MFSLNIKYYKYKKIRVKVTWRDFSIHYQNKRLQISFQKGCILMISLVQGHLAK